MCCLYIVDVSMISESLAAVAVSFSLSENRNTDIDIFLGNSAVSARTEKAAFPLKLKLYWHGSLFSARFGFFASKENCEEITEPSREGKPP